MKIIISFKNNLIKRVKKDKVYLNLIFNFDFDLL